MRMKSRIMYIEDKSGGLVGPARIGRVTFSKTARTIYYGGRSFQSIKGQGFKANYYDVATGDHFWISGPRRDGCDALYRSNTSIEIDDDVREEYWRDIRGQPGRVNDNAARADHANRPPSRRAGGQEVPGLRTGCGDHGPTGVSGLQSKAGLRA